MSALILCQECYSWAEPTSDVCPFCAVSLDPNQPDPTLESLEDLIGPIEFCLGEVTTPRRLLPDRGMLYGTRGGLLFIPHDLSRRVIPAQPWTASASLLWATAALLWSPLAIAGALLRFKTIRPAEILLPIPRPVPEGNPSAAASQLMDDPGVFFVPRRNIRCLRRTWRGWTIDCRDRKPIVLRPTQRDIFAENLQQEPCRSTWAAVTMG